jgi:uncharacterized protein (TIGR00369 family)
MSLPTPADSEYEARVRASFARQRVMQLFGARLERVGPGEVVIALPFREDLSQQDGYLHAGVITTIADSACGYAAYTLMPADSGVLSVEFKVNLLRPAEGEEFVAEAQVLKAGRTLSVTRCDVYARAAGESKMVATMLATMIRR